MKERQGSTHIIEQWFGERGWVPFPFQRESWAAYLAGRSGLIHAPTGMGKSLAAWLGPLLEWMGEHPDPAHWAETGPPGLRVLWITPLRALANDTAATLRAPAADLGLPWTVELRTGDTAASVKQRQRKTLPSALVTTPESLTLLLSYPETQRLFRDLRCVVVDEWHELLGTKRGVQTELALARLRRWLPRLRVWGLSATLGNMAEAAAVLVPRGATPEAPLLVAAEVAKEIVVETLIPASIERFPWAGHLGLKLLPEVARAVASALSTLIFTNTRAQTEIWFRALIDAHHEFAGEIALHHGSLERALRQEVEDRLGDGRLRAVVSTSSLDLGVDFAPVNQVIQVGSPKGVARLMQRAGRSGHHPGVPSRVLCVPTHAFELVEFAAARRAIAARAIEARPPLEKPLDVLVQHAVTVALGGGFTRDELLSEIRTAYAYRHLTEAEWQWVLEFVLHGGASLRAYEQYAKVVERDGVYTVESQQIARFHRMSIGSITSDTMIKVAFLRGANLGSIEESFVARLRPGDRFVFAGRLLELVMVRDMTAYVRAAAGNRGIVPRWMGGRMPLSTQLAAAVRAELAAARAGRYDSPEMEAVRPLLDLQAAWSRIPGPGELLIEQTKTRDGHHLFLFPLAGRAVHEGLAALLAHRITRGEPRTVGAFATDYGVELLSPEPFAIDAAGWRALLSTEGLVEDVLECVNSGELARRQFRDIARVAGLIFSGYPGSKKTARQLQTSSGILYDVFSDYEPDNLLLDQARREVLEQQLEVARLRATLEGLRAAELVIVPTRRLTPLAFPLWAERLRAQQVSTEDWEARVKRMAGQLEAAASQ